MIRQSDIENKIYDIISSNNGSVVCKTLAQIMIELAKAPASIDALVTVDKTIDMVCEETFG